MRKVIAVSVCMLLILLCSCGEKELYGNWRSVAENGTALTLSENGEVTMEIDGLKLSGSYVVNNSLITMNVSDEAGNAYTINASYELVDEELHLTNAQGQVEVFK